MIYMNFQSLEKIENADAYLDMAFKEAKKPIEKKIGGDKLAKIKYMEIEKVNKFHNQLASQLHKILRNFPNIDDLPTFYIELIKTTLDYVKLKKSLGTLSWSLNKINDLKYNVTKGLKKAPRIEILVKERKAFHGRASSFMKQSDSSLRYLEEARKVMKSFPNIKTSLKTVCICGFPNIGKTTLLTKLTSANPEINTYAFTTKKLNLGYFNSDYEKVQVIDTPGTLNRFNKMNQIEKQAYLAVRYCADLIVYIFDLTEPYSLEEQKRLYEVLKGYEKKIIFYLSKTDILDKEKSGKEKLNMFKKENNFKFITDSEKLKEEIVRRLKE